MQTRSDLWTYRESYFTTGAEIIGYGVEALDGSIGKVDESTTDAGSAHIVVDTGPWIFGKKVMLPAGVIRSVDEDEQTVSVNRTKDEIKNAPEFDPLAVDPAYRSSLDRYYGPGGQGYRDWS